MGTVVQFPRNTNVVPLRGLTRKECAAVKEAADTLIEQGHSTGSSIHKDGQYMCVFGPDGTPLMISRQNGICYLVDENDMILARSQRFDIVLQALEAAFFSPDDSPA